jgi:acetyltransferase-like isoleucine patch superfamily enzyme
MIIRGRHTLVPSDVETNVQLKFGSFCSIASGLTVVSGQHPGVANPKAISDFPFNEHGWGDYPPSNMGEGVTVGNDVWIGQGVTLLDGLHVGDGARIAAGTMVVGNVAPYAVIAGNPGELRRIRFHHDQVKALLRIEWWRWDDRRIAAALEDMADVRTFISKFDLTPMKGTT